MQEPILFNWSIKDNIKYGKDDASDEEVYKAALAANAIEFIETKKKKNMTKNELLEELSDSLETQLFKFFSEQNLQSIQVQSLLDKWSEKQKQLVLNILNNSDKKVLELMASEWSKFLRFIETDGDLTGMKWDDIILRFEWSS